MLHFYEEDFFLNIAFISCLMVDLLESSRVASASPMDLNK